MSADDAPTIRLLTSSDAEPFWHLRLEALEREPTAFGSAAEDHRATTVGDVATRLANPNTRVMGVFVSNASAGERLRGMAGLAREARPKTRHKASIWGVYLGPELRGQGHGRALLAALIAHARTLPGLELLTIAVTTTQPAALALYQALGFTAWGLEPQALKVKATYVDEHYLTLALTHGT